ncbi:hypothetical protein QRO11_04960 [Paracidovorax citrulli]|uniref:hypothetical protein n=1 Tax=Paracidovorax citrulli TaxID=80869 RepID=UPI0002F1CADC|nr:hypothetical protein [Paracidovorax citrulli]QCX09822.1 hypothetical protein APS58_0903 [Paracidovorax citrulli]UEG47183.1 hypothetical protein LKW27_04710 [Paracidovorax citrulli]UMT89540.1 hypothetical protein FRC90_16695 [Paracidovorax citrulli]UMT93618.1 hypothetical protein FRC97_00510 [Paracidovorax citrulli]WIY35695.1 hypothetical protein QRO11_04960 [Paracidovorax citrulli]
MEAQKFADKAADTAHDVAGDMLDNAQDAVRTTRDAANKTLDKAERKVRELQSDVDPVIDDLAARAQDLASRGIAYCADTSERARRQFNQAADATARYVAEQPGKSLAIAAAAGAFVATLCMLARRPRSRDY